MGQIIELKQLCDFCKSELTESEKENKLKISINEVAKCPKHIFYYQMFCPSCLRRLAYLYEHGLKTDHFQFRHY